MSDRSRLPQSPDAKDPFWRGGAFFVAWACSLILWDLLLGDAPAAPRWMPLVMLFAGLLLSMRYGLGWLQGAAKDHTETQYLANELPGQQGATYFVLQKDAVRPKNPRRDFTGGWLVAHSLVWRMPVIVGDALLEIVWNLAGRVQGRNDPTLRREDALRRFNEEEEREKQIPRGF